MTARTRRATFSVGSGALFALFAAGFVPADPTPVLKLTYVPPYGSFEQLRGEAMLVPPEAYRVAVYIYRFGWWTKPTFDSPLTPLNADGSWACTITTGGSDQYATEIAAFLVRASYMPPACAGDESLPADLFDVSVARAFAKRTPRQVNFSDYGWTVKAGRWGPGPNHFSDSQDNVWVDDQGRLHLRLSHDDAAEDGWYCAEVCCNHGFGYGTYRFHLDTPVDDLDPNEVLGLFTWSDAAEYSHREIDIEFSHWANPGDPRNAQYVVQPHEQAGHRYRWSLPPGLVRTSHEFTWLPNQVSFRSIRRDDGALIHEWSFGEASAIPIPGDETPRINLWLFEGNPPVDGVEREVIVSRFAFTPVLGDGYEVDDTPAQARWIPTDGTKQSHHFHVAADVDWLKFTALEKGLYTIETAPGSGEPLTCLYAPDGATQISCAAYTAASGTSTIRWQCDAGGVYYLKISALHGLSSIGTYAVSVAEWEPTADLNGDGAFNDTDWALFARAWREAHDPAIPTVDPRGDVASAKAEGGYERHPDGQITVHDAWAFSELFAVGK